MKKQTQKTLALAAALMLAASPLAACKKSGGNEADLERGSKVTLNGDAIYPMQCDDTLTYWMGQGAWNVRYENFADTPLGKKLAENTGAKIQYIHPSEGQGEEQFQLLLASDELPDIITYAWNDYPGGPDIAISEGYIMQLNEVFDKWAPALKKRLSENDAKENWDKQMKTDTGAYYAFPNLVQSGILQVAQGPILRADWLKKYNLETPTTIDEWEKVLQTFKDNGVESPFSGTVGELGLTFMPAFGVWKDYYKDGDKIVFGYMEEGYKNYLAKMNDWFKKGLIDKDLAVNTPNDIDSKVLNGKTGAMCDWAGSGIGQWLKAANGANGFDLMGVQYPAMNKGENAEYSSVANNITMRCGAALNTKCKNPELAARFLDYGFTEEGHNLFNFGIEGESYNWVDKDGVKYPQYTDLILNNPEGLTVTNAMSMYIRANYNGIMIQDTRYIEQYYQTPQQSGAQKEWGKTNMRDHLLPQLYVLGEEADRDSQIKTDVTTYVNEQTIRFITGERPIEEFDAYVEQLKAFGIDDALKFRTEAYKRFEKR